MLRTLLAILAVTVFTSVGFSQDPGVLPIGADGKPLNLDFETGTLKDWTAEGDAFKGQPIKGDTVAKRRNDSKSEHQGNYWIGGFEKFADKPTGTLTSASFKITHPWASFLVGGGPWMETCVELRLVKGDKLITRVSGIEEENLRRVAVDLRGYKDNDMYLRLVDRHTGHWGHINFDDFRFHDKKPNVPPRPGGVADAFKHNGLTPEAAAKAMTVPEGFDVTLFAGEPDVMQPIALALDDRGRVWVAEAYSYPVRRKDKDARDRILIFEDTKGTGKFDKRTVFMEGLNLVSGLEVGFGGVWIGAAPNLMFVPMKEVPAKKMNDAGAVGWVEQRETHTRQVKGLTEAVSLATPLSPRYSGGRGDGGEGGAGSLAERVGRCEGQPPSPPPLSPRSTGRERGAECYTFSDVCPLTWCPWVEQRETHQSLAAIGGPRDARPTLQKQPKAETITVPAGPPQILLDGWGYQDTHETLNSFIWGPDGWLYGCHGIFTHSKVGKPGTPDKERVPLNAGVWRYHPTRHKFEVFAHGTSNPWGLDFNEYGQAFVSSCVIPHCFHIIQGGRYHRQAANHFNPHTYDDIKTIADHLHWQGANPWAGNNKSDVTGGGHAHCGLMCYLGGTWPAEYRGQLFMGNIHGRRINMDTLKPKGSGYVASHGKDLLLANDSWARFVNMRYGPDGNVYVIDWYDKQACHSGNIDIWDRSNGRIYKISHRNAKPVVGVDLQKKSDIQLVRFQSHENDWFVRHSRRILQERAITGKDKSTQQGIAVEFCVLAETGQKESTRLRGLWAEYLYDPERRSELCSEGIEDKRPNVRAWSVRLASEGDKPQILLKDDASPVVRLALASSLQRIPPVDRWTIAENLLKHAEDADDHNLPLMYWYAIEPLADVDPARALALALNGKIPLLHGYMIRRIGAGGDATSLLIEALAKTPDAGKQLTFLTATREALKGRRTVPMPDAWPKLFGKFQELSVNDERRQQAVCQAVTFGNPGPALDMVKGRGNTFNQAAAIGALLDAGHPKLIPELHWLLDSELKGTMARRLALRGLANYDDPASPGEILRRFPNYTPEERVDALNTLAARPSYAKALLNAVAKKEIAPGDISADIVRQLRNLKDKDVSARINEVWGVLRDSPAERVKAIADYKKMLTTTPATPPDLAQGRALFNKSCAACHTLYGFGGKVGPDLTGSNRANLDYLLENILDPSAVIPKEYAAAVVEMQDGRTITGIVRSDTKVTVTLATANEVLTLPRKEIDTLTVSKTSLMPDDLLRQLSEPEVRALIGYLRNPNQVPLPK